MAPAVEGAHCSLLQLHKTPGISEVRSVPWHCRRSAQPPAPSGCPCGYRLRPGTHSATPRPRLAPDGLSARRRLLMATASLGWRSGVRRTEPLGRQPFPLQGTDGQVCRKCPAHPCQRAVMMIIINNNNNLDVKLFRRLGLMDAESNTGLPGSCIGPPALQWVF